MERLGCQEKPRHSSSLLPSLELLNEVDRLVPLVIGQFRSAPCLDRSLYGLPASNCDRSPPKGLKALFRLVKVSSLLQCSSCCITASTVGSDGVVLVLPPPALKLMN